VHPGQGYDDRRGGTCPASTTGSSTPLTGQPTVTDGASIIGNLGAEAGISRASYYRSPAAAVIKEALDAG
jgi:hypothetical protein